ncbi:MAG TPA: diaminopimelate epimerase [Thermoplasmata archaeon]|nr:diaminopimelate epimerase [Thermoplasmata archaeon]
MKYDFRFVKYQGCGNDFILKDETSGLRTPDADRSAMAKFLWNRNFWVGADGVLFVEDAPGVDGSMRLFEPAGNEADMCGNGLRCVAAYLMTKLGKEDVDVLTGDGVKHVSRDGEGYRVDMGPVRTLRKDLAGYVAEAGLPEDSMLQFRVDTGSDTVGGSIVDTGEPHIVLFTDALDSVPLVKVGEGVNADKRRFPESVNINYVQVTGQHDISIRTYERGVFNETLACGTGATACACVSLLLGKVQPGPVNVRTKGGMMRIELGPDGRAVMTGPAVRVFEGRLEVEV